MLIRVQQQDFDIGAVNRELCGGRSDIGAIASFIGLVRDLPQNRLHKMTLEHYPGMTEKALSKIVETAQQRWEILDAAIIHRIGDYIVDEPYQRGFPDLLLQFCYVYN